MTEIVHTVKRLTPTEEAFCQAVMVERSQMRAYTAVFNTKGNQKGPQWANLKATELASRPHIAARIRELRNLAAQAAVVEMADVMREWFDIARADPNELISYRRVCCRHCYGRGNLYQWKNEQEFADALADAMDHNAFRKFKKQQERELPTKKGGLDFDHTKPPAVNCPVCKGEGVGEVFVADTTKLSGPAAKLYAGVKVGKNGQIEILMRDQDAALANLAKAMGMFVGKEPPKEGESGNPVEFLRELQKMLPN